MNTRYLLLAALAIIAGLFLWILPMQDNAKELTPKLLLDEVKDQTRYYTTDEVAQMIINGDPSIILVDVRTEKEYSLFSLPGSINIPIDSTLLPGNVDFIDDATQSIVFISGDGTLAEQCWLLYKRMGLNNIHIMQGGLDRWVETILKPVEPSQATAGSEHALYSARLGARQFFTGVGTGGSVEQAATPRPQAVPLSPRKKLTSIEGGC